MTSDLNQLLSLPVETLVVLGAGYMAYRLAYTGRDAHHRSIDTIFLTVVFAAIAKLVLQFSEATVPLGWAVLSGCMTALSAAAFWRRFGARWLLSALRKSRISLSDPTITAWDKVRSDDTARPSQLLVLKRDGTQLMCEALAEFANERFGPCIYGTDGSVALFVTHQLNAGDDDWQILNHPAWAEWGTLLTYIPASEIAGISVRN